MISIIPDCDNTVKKHKSFIPLIILVVILIAIGVGAYFFAKNISREQTQDELTEDVQDELSRIRWFITDWYDELKEQGALQVFLNELRLGGGKYTLTYASDRIRAVYPRGERFFKLELVTKVEFITVNNILRCRLYYGRNGEFSYRIN